MEAESKNGKKFVDLMKRYNNFDEITPYMVNEFVDRIMVHERDRKGSTQTTQKIDIYFNFIGNYSMPVQELTEEEKAEIASREAYKDKCHQKYLKRKQDGSQQRWEKKNAPRRMARLARVKAQNPNTYGIPAEEYDEEHFSAQSLVLAGSERVNS